MCFINLLVQWKRTKGKRNFSFSEDDFPHTQVNLHFLEWMKFRQLMPPRNPQNQSVTNKEQKIHDPSWSRGQAQVEIINSITLRNENWRLYSSYRKWCRKLKRNETLNQTFSWYCFTNCRNRSTAWNAFDLTSLYHRKEANY